MSNQKKDYQNSNNFSNNKKSYSNSENDMHGANGHDGNNGMYGMDRTSGRTATMDTETHREWDKSLGEHDEHEEYSEECCDGKSSDAANCGSKDSSWKSSESSCCSNDR